MSKTLIGTLVGALILFFWQFASWGPLNVHGAENQYTPKQDQILAFLAESGLEEGTFMMPNVPPGASSEEFEAMSANAIGKPWAKISYNKTFEMNMGMNLFRGMVIDLLSVFLLCWILLKFADLNFTAALLTSLAVGAIGYMTIPYLGSIWYEGDTMGYIIDLVVGWGLVGAWLGWWLPR